MPFSRPAFLRPISVLAVLAVTAAGLATVPGAVASVPPQTSAKSQLEAARLAATTGARVEIEDQTTEYTRSFANPAGTVTTEVSNSPQRVRRGAGWVTPDATLEFRPDGSVGPKAALADLSFSSGGTTALARIGAQTGVLELATPWKLPKPTLSGSKAVYSGVQPGVDLVIDATLENFSYNLVVATPAAAANPALKSVRFAVTGKGLSLRDGATGKPRYVDAAGRSVLAVTEAMMWDSAGKQANGRKATSLSAAEAVGEGATAGSRRAAMKLRADSSGLVFEPDQALLTNPATVYPVVLDPTLTGQANRSSWAAAWELYPTTSFYKTTHSLGVGYDGWEQNKIVRSFFQFDVAGMAGKKILKAFLRTYEVHAANCDPQPVIVSRVSPISAATTWSNQPKWQADVTTLSVAKGYSASCPPGNVEFNVTSSMQYTSSNNGKTTTFRLRAGSETDKFGWKQFDSTGLLTIEYINYPLAPTDLGVAAPSDQPIDCAPATDPTVIAERRPTITGIPRVVGGGSQADVKMQIELYNSAGTLWTLTSALKDSAQLQSIPIGFDLANGTVYRFHARTLHPYPGGELVSPWSGYCFFKIDTTPPPAPVIVATYQGKVVTDCLKSGSICPEEVPFGEAVTYKISSSSTEVSSISYWYDGVWRNVAGRSVTVALYPPGQGWNTMTAYSRDAAQRQSTPARYRINVGPPAPAIGSWKFDESSGTTAADASGNGHPMTLTGATPDDAGRVNGSIMLDGGADYASTPASVLDTSKSFSVSAWVRLTEFEESGVVGIPGANGLGFQLYYSKGAHRWVFMQNTSDSETAGQARIESDLPPVYGAWTHLAGSFDADNKTITLYVNGRTQGTTAFTHTPWKATGPLEVGHYRFGGTYGAHLAGTVDEVQVWQRAIPGAEAATLANPRVTVAGSAETVAGLAAHWPFDQTYLASDQIWRTSETVYTAGMSLAGFGSTSDQQGALVEDPERGRVLGMTGKAAEAVSLPRTVVHGGGSFTIAVWAKLTDTSRPTVIARQAGTTKDPWRIEYRPTGGNGAEWVFSRATADSATGTVVEATAPTSLDIAADEWTLVVATYDAVANEIQLKLRDRGYDGGEVRFTSPVATGTTVVGAGPSAAPAKLNGLLDDLRIYSGVLSQRRICNDLLGGTDCS